MMNEFGLKKKVSVHLIATAGGARHLCHHAWPKMYRPICSLDCNVPGCAALLAFLAKWRAISAALENDIRKCPAGGAAQPKKGVGDNGGWIRAAGANFAPTLSDSPKKISRQCLQRNHRVFALSRSLNRLTRESAVYMSPCFGFFNLSKKIAACSSVAPWAFQTVTAKAS